MHRHFAAIAFLMVTVQAHGQLIEQEQQGVCPPLIRSKYGGVERSTVPPIRELPERQIERALIQPDFQIASAERNWDSGTFGSTSTLGLRFTASISHRRTDNKPAQVAQGKVIGYAFGRTYDVLTASVSQRGSNRTCNSRVNVLGDDRHNENGGETYSKNFQKEARYGTTFDVRIAGYGVRVKVGGWGMVGVPFTLVNRPSAVEAAFMPIAGLGAYGEASIGGWLLEAGVRTNFTLVQASLPLWINTRVEGSRVRGNRRLDFELSGLGPGRVQAYVKVAGQEVGSATLFTWGGVQLARRTIFNESF